MSVPSLCGSESLFFLRLRWEKIGAEFRFDFNRLSSSSSSDDDCRWRLNVLLCENFSLRRRCLKVVDTRRDNDDVRFLVSSCSSFKSDSGSIRRLLWPIERVSSALDLAWRVVVICSCSKNRNSLFFSFGYKNKYTTFNIRFVCRWFTFGTKQKFNSIPIRKIFFLHTSIIVKIV